MARHQASHDAEERHCDVVKEGQLIEALEILLNVPLLNVLIGNFREAEGNFLSICSNILNSENPSKEIHL